MVNEGVYSSQRDDGDLHGREIDRLPADTKITPKNPRFYWAPLRRDAAAGRIQENGVATVFSHVKGET